MKKRRLGLLPKFAIAFSAVALTAGAVVGFMKLYAQQQGGLGRQAIDVHSDLSTKVEVPKVQRATFIDGKEQVYGELVLENLSEQSKIKLSVDLGKYKKGTLLDYQEFVQVYLEQTNDLPRFKVESGPIVFLNEYVESLMPHEFVEYTNWFLQNVSWGPDLLTLKHFKLARGIKTSGSSITLGQHGGGKENTEIEFYPDAFFGSLPIYSTNRGRGNSPDALTHEVNSSGMLRDELEQYLKNIPWMISYFNATQTSSGVRLYETLPYAENLYIFDASSYLDLTKDPKDYQDYLAAKKANQTLNNKFLLTAKDQQAAKEKALVILKELLIVKGFSLKPNFEYEKLVISDQSLTKATKVISVQAKENKVKNEQNPRAKELEFSELVLEINGHQLDQTNPSKQTVNINLLTEDFANNEGKVASDRGLPNQLTSAISNAYYEITKEAFDAYLKAQVNFRNFLKP